jgi:hypothetical protein
MEQEEEIMEEVVWHWWLEAGVQIQDCFVARLATIQQFLGEVKEQRAQDRAFSTHQYQGIAAGIWCIHRQPNQVLLHAAHNQNAIQQQLAGLLLPPQLPMGTSTPTTHHSVRLPTCFLTFGLNGQSELVVGSPQKTSQQLSVDEKNSNILVARSCGN